MANGNGEKSTLPPRVVALIAITFTVLIVFNVIYDAVTPAYEGLPTTTLLAAIHLLDGFTFNCRTGEQRADTRSSTLAELVDA